MTFKTAWKNFWGKYFNISDVATRREFWLVFPIIFGVPFLTYQFISAVLFEMLLAGTLGIDWIYSAMTIFVVMLFAVMVPMTALFARRFREVGLPIWIPILLVGASYLGDIVWSFNQMFAYEIPTALWSFVTYTWWGYMFALGVCAAPGLTKKKG